MEHQAASDAPPIGREYSSKQASVLPARRRRAHEELIGRLYSANRDSRYFLSCPPEARLLPRSCDCAPAGGKREPSAHCGCSLSGRTREYGAGGSPACRWSWCCLANSTFKRCSAARHSSGERHRAKRGNQMAHQSRNDFFQSEYLHVEDFSSEIEKLQEMLYRYSCGILSPEDVHILRHVLCAERIGPLMPGKITLLHELLSHTGSNALTSSERQLFIKLLKKRANGGIHTDEDVILRTLLLRALANSLSSEQQLNASAALQNKCAPPLSPCLLDDLRRTMNGPDHRQGRYAVQAALEEQLAPYCGWAERMAIHRLLFLEPPWPLSPEERRLLETLYVQPAVWWSPAQENRFFTSLAKSRAGGTQEFTDEAFQLLLQLLGASLTSPQRQHLTALLGVPCVQVAGYQPSTILPNEGRATPTPGQVRTMALLQRVVEGEALTPVENGFLQDGILRELLQLLPPEDLQVLYKLVLSSDPVPVPRSSVLVLEELQRARELWESSGDLTACVEQIGCSWYRQMFMYCLALSLTAQQLKVLTQLIHENSEEQELDKEQQRSQEASASLQRAAWRAYGPRHGDNVGYAAAEEPKARCTAEKDARCIIQEGVRGHAEFPTYSVEALTRQQADILELLLELHHFGCQASKQDDVLMDLLRTFKFSGPIFDQPLEFVNQLLLVQFSMSLSDGQVECINHVIRAAQFAPHYMPAHNHARADCGAVPTSGDAMIMQPFQFHSKLITPSQRQLLQWLLLQKINHGCARLQHPLSRQGVPPLMNGKSPSELYVIVPYQPLLQLATSLSDAQVEMLLLLLDESREEPTDPGSEGAGGSLNIREVDDGSAKEGIPASQEIGTSMPLQPATQHRITICPSTLEGRSCTTKDADDTMTLHTCKKGAVENLLPSSKGFRDEDFAELIPCQSAELQNHQEGPRAGGSVSSHALSPLDVSPPVQLEGADGSQPTGRALLDGADGAENCDASPSGDVSSQGRLDGGPRTNGKIAAGLPSPNSCREQPPTPRTCSPEDLAHKRRMMQHLILEAADQRIFLEELKAWRRQYNQRAKLREVLNPYILRIQALQQGYLKRCPCLYHQQQDQKEEEERQANLKLLDSLESSIWGTGDHTPSQLGSFSFQGRVYSSGELQAFGSEEFGTLRHGSSSSSGLLSLATAFRQSASTLVGRTFSKDIYCSTRQQSLASASECCSLEQASKSSASARDSRSSASPVAKTPSHCSSLGSAPVLGSSECQSPVSSPIRLRSPSGSRAERHQRSSSRDESISRGDLEVSVEERKKRMQRQALEKAQRIKEDARVAFLVVFMKQLQPGNPAFGIELVDRINLSHLNAKTLPKGKGWKTQGLLRMIQGIVRLVCKLPRGAEVASTLQPLLALANQTRAEDIDLAIHAELEGIRRALLRLPVGGATSPEKGQVGEGQAESLQRDGKRKSNEVFMGYATAGTEEEGTKLTSTEVPAPAVTAVTQEASHQDSKINQLKTEEGQDSSGQPMALQKGSPTILGSRGLS